MFSRQPHRGLGEPGLPRAPEVWCGPRRVTHFRFRCLAPLRHGLHGGESRRCCVSSAAAGPLLASGQVLGTPAHLQRAREPAAHRVAAGEELLREVAEAAGASAAGCLSAVGRRGETHRGLGPAPARASSRLSPARKAVADLPASVSRALSLSHSCSGLWRDPCRSPGRSPRPTPSPDVFPLKGLTALLVEGEAGHGVHTARAGSPEPALTPPPQGRALM